MPARRVDCWLPLRRHPRLVPSFRSQRGQILILVRCAATHTHGTTQRARRFVAGDYELEAGVLGVEPVSSKTAEHVRRCIADYGANLVDLPPESWQTSVAQWYGTHWDILVDLWTAEEGRSDLVLSGKVVETHAGPRFTVHMVYVP